MKALEFKSRIKNNQIQIPMKVQSELKTNKDKNVRVIVLLDESDNDDDFTYQDAASAQFLKGYAETDSIYDNY